MQHFKLLLIIMKYLHIRDKKFKIDYCDLWGKFLSLIRELTHVLVYDYQS